MAPARGFRHPAGRKTDPSARRRGADPLTGASPRRSRRSGRCGGRQGGEMSFADTLLTRLAGPRRNGWPRTPARRSIAAEYAENDLLCYRAETPPALVHRQAREWQPWLDWAALDLDAPLRSRPASAMSPERGCAARLRRAVAGSNAALTGLGVAVPALGAWCSASPSPKASSTPHGA